MTDTAMHSEADPHSPLLETLRALEWALHHPGQGLDADALDALLHPDFHEVGKSGLQYGRAQVMSYLRQLSSVTPQTSVRTTDALEHAVALMAPECALLTYLSIHHEPGGPLRVRRSSLWVLHEGRWRLRYHQGTIEAAT